eukprot:6971726-Alexandrium_andersonii.AAC.1
MCIRDRAKAKAVSKKRKKAPLPDAAAGQTPGQSSGDNCPSFTVDLENTISYTLQSLGQDKFDWDCIDAVICKAITFAFQREVAHNGKPVKSWAKLRGLLKDELCAGHSRHKLMPRASDPDTCVGSKRKKLDRGDA